MTYHALGAQDPLQDFIATYPQQLDALFLPKSVAVIGAKDTIGSVGRTIMTNLLSSSFGGRIYPINPKRDTVFNLKSYPVIAAVPEAVDLVIIVTPAATVPGLVAECVMAKAKSAIIISAGFKELGAEGNALEKKILQIIHNRDFRIIGPNCLGVMNPIYGLNATFAKGIALKGNIAFLSQSGAMCTAVLDWSVRARIGFSAFVSVGSMADVDWSDLILYLGNDPTTHSILIYMETIGNPRAFLSAARYIALDKPIVVIKPGRSKEAAKAASSHTGALVGSDEVFEAAMERVGVLRVNTISELFDMAALLGKQPKPKGPRLAIVTNAGGPAVLATDATVIHGAKVSELQQKSIDELNKTLPEAWSHSNPVDILGDASPERYARACDVVMRDENNDGVLVILSPQDVTNPVESAESLIAHGNHMHKPLLASWMGGSFVEKGIEILNQAKIPTFSYPDDAARSFATAWNYTNNLASLYETPALHATTVETRAEIAKKLVEHIRQAKRKLLTEHESKMLLAAYGIPVVETKVAQTADEAVAIATTLHYPVVVKLYSHTITHKSDIGGVRLDLKNAEEVKHAFDEIKKVCSQIHGSENFQGVTVQPMVRNKGIELIFGSSLDPQFGPVLLFGAGGTFVEIWQDRALGLPPLNSTLARKLIQKTKIYQALKGFRGKKGVHLDVLEQLLVQFSLMIADNPSIKECDINPLLASSDGIIAVDARVVLTEEGTGAQLAIRPYPAEYIEKVRLKDGTHVVIRPIKPEDEPLVRTFHKELSEHSVRQRYFAFMSLDERIAHKRLLRICMNDFDRELSIVAEVGAGEGRKIVGVIRIVKTPGTYHGQLTLIIQDGYHGKGLGTLLLRHSIDIAQKEQITSIGAIILSENVGMISLCRKYGFTLEVDETGLYTQALLKLK